MAKTIKHKGRLAGWTDGQKVGFYRAVKGALSGRLVRWDSIHPRPRRVLERRCLIFEFKGKVQLTDMGLAVANSCGWVKKNRRTPHYL